MATVRALSLALLLALCFAACACAPAKRRPTNRYISYAGVPHARGAVHGRTHPGCSVFAGRCPGSRSPAPTKAGATTTAAAGSKGDMSRIAALPSDDKHSAPTKAGAKTGGPGSKGRYISPAAMSADKPCGRLGCRSRP